MEDYIPNIADDFEHNIEFISYIIFIFRINVLYYLDPFTF